MKLLRTSVLFMVLLYACQKDTKAPVQFYSVIEYLDDQMSQADISKLRSKEDKGFPPYYHQLDIQETIQYELSKNDQNWQIINTYFDSLGIENTTDKYGLIINMYQNYINDIDIDINDEIALVKSYWAPLASCDSVQKKQASFNFKHIEVNDTITIQMPVDEHENAVDYSCPNIDWTYHEAHDLGLQVIIRKKVNNNAINLNFFEVEILSMSNEFTSILSQEISEGDLVKIPIKTAWKLKPKS